MGDIRSKGTDAIDVGMEDGAEGGLEEACRRIRTMEVRGAARIGRTAAQALARHLAGGEDDVHRRAVGAAARLLATRPTAVSLRHGVGAVLQAVEEAEAGGGAGGADPAEAARAGAEAFLRDQEEARRDLRRHALEVLEDGARVLTHCHSSTVEEALAYAVAEGRDVRVVCTETRPFNQGRITSAALADAGVPVAMVVDSAVASLLAAGRVDRVLVGADTITRDGSLFNKIGTYGVARSAADHGVPFRCLATWEKFLDAPPAAVEVEQRAAAEVWDRPPRGVDLLNPAFDRTPPELVGAYLTSAGPQDPARAVGGALERAPRSRWLDEALAQV